MKNILQIFSLFTVMILLAGCPGGGGGGGGGGNTTSQPNPPAASPTPGPLTVKETVPDNTANILVDQSIVVVFGKAVNQPLTVGTLTNLDDVRLVGTEHHPITVSVSGDRLTVTPVTNLAGDSNYSLMITADLKGADGSSLTQTYVKNFHTVPSEQNDKVLALRWCYDTSPVIVPTHFIAHWGKKSLNWTLSQKLTYTLSTPTEADSHRCDSNDIAYDSVVDFEVERPMTYYVIVKACTDFVCSVPSNEVTRSFD